MLHVSLATCHAHALLLSCMWKAMFLQFTSSNKSFPTKLTQMWYLSIVFHVMNPQTAGLTAAYATHSTHIYSLLSPLQINEPGLSDTVPDMCVHEVCWHQVQPYFLYFLSLRTDTQNVPSNWLKNIPHYSLNLQMLPVLMHSTAVNALNATVNFRPLRPMQ
jgi:hypothetical protein